MSATVVVHWPGVGPVRLAPGTVAIVGHPAHSTREQVIMTVPGERWAAKSERYLEGLAEDGYTVTRVVSP